LVRRSKKQIWIISPANFAVGQVIVTVLACWLASGIVFGFAALKPVLLSEGVYEDLCSDEEVDDDVGVCFKQELQ
jgi:hypothetical protein